MSFEYEEKPANSRFVDVIWRTHDTSDGTYLAAADACWDMIFIRSVHGNRVLLSGPSSKITPVPYRAGNRNVGIRFHRGSFLTHVRTTTMVDTTEALPMPTPETFLLAGFEWAAISSRNHRRIRGDYGLTRREREVFALLAEGRTNRQIVMRCSSLSELRPFTLPTSSRSSTSRTAWRLPPLRIARVSVRPTSQA